MKKNAAYRQSSNPRSRLAPLALLATAVLFLAFGGAASAAPPIGKDGKIHACYRVKGKPKGSLRIAPGKRCKRGERRVVWSVAGSSDAGGNGQTGATGQQGADQQGQAVSNGSSSSNEAALKTEVATLALKVEALEDVLDGVTNGDLQSSLTTLQGLDNADLLGAVDTVQGLTNADLTEAVESLPAVESLCAQTPLLAEQANQLQGVVGGLDLGGTLKTLGLLEIPDLPTELEVDEFGCAAP